MLPPPLPALNSDAGARTAALGLVIADGQEWSVRALAEAIERSWPAPLAPPHITVVPLEEADPEGFDAVLVLGADSPRGGTATLANLADHVEETLTPTILLTTAGDPALRGLVSENVILLPPTTPPSTLTCVLHTLAARQPAVRRLKAELRATQVLQGGVSAEIDRIQEELLLAGHIQREFLPKAYPDLPGLSFDVYFRPAGFVSGDVYDVVRLDEHHVGFILADAMGHGAAAALLTLFVSAQLALKQTYRDSYRLIPPADALANLNTALSRARGGAARLVSAVCGVIDARTGEVTMAAAGHPPPVLVTRKGAEPLDVSGMLLGVIDDAEYEHVRLRLGPGDVLVLYSDGIVAPPVNPTTLLPHMLRTFGPVTRGERTLQSAMVEVAAELDDTAGSLHQADDITVLAIAAGELPTKVDEPGAEERRTDLLSAAG